MLLASAQALPDPMRPLALSAIPRWYVVRSGGPEKRTIAELERFEVAFYYPQIWGQERVPKRQLTSNRRNAVVMRPVKVPLWRRYFFINFDLYSGHWRECFERAAIHGILANSEGGRLLPAPVDDEIIARIRGLEVEGVIPPTIMVRHLLFAAGERVALKNKPVTEGIVHESYEKPFGGLDETAKIKIAISLLGKTHLVEVPVGDLEKL